MDKNNNEQTPRNPAIVGDNTRASWQISLDALRANIAKCNHEGKELLISSFLWCIDERHPVHRKDFARGIGYSDNVIYKLITGTYRNPNSGEQLDIPAKMINAMREFLRLERARYETGSVEFVMTPTAKSIHDACDLARESQTPVFLTGPSHIGKTWALEHYTQANNHGRTVYIRMLAASGLGGMVRRIATKVGVSDKSNTASLISRIKRAISPNMLLILDELHLLSYTYRKESFFASLEVIREIHDETKCGMVLCGTKLLLDKTDGHAHAELEQILNRGVHRRVLPKMPTKPDLTAILAAWQLQWPSRELSIHYSGIDEQPYEILRQESKRFGLKAITERLRYARKLASKRDEKLDWKHFVEAHLRIAAQAVETPEWH